ncbi:MAG TPA: vWA domain-containing protein [Methylibium sp.]|uniref:vWA domain-containing protein n=1 Tax=Methylibium sp. TaxID=2067992 RepID=UPI002DBF4F2B|nr:vWA domain-containing protein [Methylibium sp.]HEU4460093.1 vWA domain-containing protein [Methylibium sp.]
MNALTDRLRRAGLAGPRGGLLLAAVAIALCFLRPSVPATATEQDLLFMIDVTQSMEVADVRQGDAPPITRSRAAHEAIAAALRRLPCGSRIGFGLFTEYRSFLLLRPVELCENQRELIAMLGRIDTQMAWNGNSEIAKGLYSGLKTARALPDKPALVFVTDGHEAPPVNPRFRPDEDGAARAVPGLIVGVGGMTPARIPKLDPEGRAYGWWGADEVLQVDPRSLGRGGSVKGEQMVDDGAGEEAPMLGATPGSEHLSSLREPYLKLLAGETGLGYHRLVDADRLLDALSDPALARRVEARADLRWVLALVALAALVAVYRPATWRRPRARSRLTT